MSPARPTTTGARRFAWAYFVSILAMTGAGILLLWLTRDVDRNEVYALESVAIEILDRIQFAAVAGLGAVIVAKQPWNRLGWIFCVMGFGFPWVDFAEAYARYGLEADPGSLPVPTLFAWTTNWVWGLTIFLLPAIFVLFPDGRPPSPRWRFVTYLSYACVAYAVVVTMFLDRIIDGFPGVANPTFVLDVGASIDDLAAPVFLVFLLLLVAGAISLIGRYRRADSEQRAQLKWFLYAAAMFCLYMIMTIVFKTQGSANIIGGVVASMALTAAVGIAILKYRLYDIDVVINKTIVFGALAGFITGIYVAIVVGIGSLLGSQDEPNLALSIAATAIVAIAFSPAKEWTQRLANRLVYGHRLSPYEVLADLSRTAATAPTPRDVLEGVARAAAIGMGAQSATVLLHLHEGDDFRVTFPEDIEGPRGEERSRSIVHRDEALGGLVVTKGMSDPFTPHDRELMEDVSAQAGLALHNARLALELQARLDEISGQAQELQSSRARIVTASDEARRRLERDITEGPRKDLLVLKQGLQDAHGLMDDDPEAAAGLLGGLTAEANETLDALRELARGIFPPLLADKGIVAALEAHVRKHDLAVVVEADDEVRAARFDESIETAVYFCCVEMLRNVSSNCSVRLGKRDGRITVSVDPVTPDAEAMASIEDRVDALGGQFRIWPSSGAARAELALAAPALEVA